MQRGQKLLNNGLHSGARKAKCAPFPSPRGEGEGRRNALLSGEKGPAAAAWMI